MPIEVITQDFESIFAFHFHSPTTTTTQSHMSTAVSNFVILKIRVPHLDILKSIRACHADLLWSIKLQLIEKTSADTPEIFNYGFYTTRSSLSSSGGTSAIEELLDEFKSVGEQALMDQVRNHPLHSLTPLSDATGV